MEQIRINTIYIRVCTPKNEIDLQAVRFEYNFKCYKNATFWAKNVTKMQHFLKGV